MTNIERWLGDDELPEGHNEGAVVEMEDTAGLPAEVSICMPVADGTPNGPYVIKPCSRCGEQVYRSPEAPDMYVLCYDCAAELGLPYGGKPS